VVFINNQKYTAPANAQPEKIANVTATPKEVIMGGVIRLIISTQNQIKNTPMVLMLGLPT
jgi:hypothetical protein